MHSFNKVFRLCAVGLVMLAGIGACNQKDKRLDPLHTSAGGTTGAGGKGGGSSLGDSGVANCGPGSCAGHSHCASGGKVCQCDTGYLGGSLPVGEPLTCTVDTSCIKLKPLAADSCRYWAGDAPAVASYFAVDYCAGTAVLPAALGPLDKAFHVTEDGVDVPAEAAVTVLHRNVESYVTFVLDVSSSVTGNKALVSELVGQMKTVVDALRPGAVTTPVGVSIIVFGRLVGEYLPFTSNLDLVGQKLDDLAADPSIATKLVDPQGTSLYAALNKGILETERIEALRDGVSEGGVLTTGTVVLITDGDDLSGATLDADQIKNTVVNLISVGISSDIDDTVLTQIGRDGSFLVPDVTARQEAFTEIAQRVKEYPLRSYLLGYCSTRTQGNHEIAVTLAGSKAPVPAKCTYDGGFFFNGTTMPGSTPPPTCDQAYFNGGECANRECGGITACGACPDSECCASGRCRAPGKVGGDCRGQDALCTTAGELCFPITGSSPPAFECRPPSPLDGVCGTQDVRCMDGVNYCQDKASDAGLALCLPLPSGDVGDECGDSTKPDRLQCKSLDCGVDPHGGSSTSAFSCLSPARINDECRGTLADAECEQGAYCPTADGTACRARKLRGACTEPSACVSGACRGVCYSGGSCYWSWDSKITL